MENLESIRDEILRIIERYDTIVIFGHANPDGDCVGSVLGLRHALRELYPEKNIYGVGTHPSYLPTFIEESDEIDDATVEKALAVLVDLSDLGRVEDQRILKAKEIVCFDHHVADKDEYAFPVYRDETAPSATYILAKVLLERFGFIPKKAAPYLFVGLVTDTGRFQYDCAPATLKMAATLVECGVDCKSIYKDLYRQNSLDLRYRAFVYDHFRFDGLVSYCCVSKAEYTKLGLTQNDAGGKVNLLSLLDNHPIWAFFTEQDDGIIRCELRSDGYYNVQEVAKRFGGGGHIPAAGCRIDSFDKVPEVVKALNEAGKVENV